MACHLSEQTRRHNFVAHSFPSGRHFGVEFFFVKSSFTHLKVRNNYEMFAEPFPLHLELFYCCKSYGENIKKFLNILYKFLEQSGKFQTIRNAGELFRLSEHFEKFETSPKW